jgi:hypothetical protein
LAGASRFGEPALREERVRALVAKHSAAAIQHLLPKLRGVGEITIVPSVSARLATAMIV